MGVRFGKVLSGYLDERYTVEFLCHVLDRNRTTFHRLLTGERDPSYELLLGIAAAFTPDPERLQAEPDRTYRKVLGDLLAAFQADRQAKVLYRLADELRGE